MKIRIGFVLLSTVILLACNFASNILSPSKTIEETPTIVVDPSDTAIATVTTTPIQSCPISSGETQLDPSTSFDEMPDSVLSYLNSGGDLDNLAGFLESLGMVTSISAPLVEEDFTGEGYLDVVLILLDPEPEFMMPSGTLILFQCQLDHYQVAYQSAITDEVNVPIIYSTADLNSDAMSDLLVGRQSCGAHTCYELLEVLSWNGTTLENIMGGSTEDMPSPTIEIFPEENEFLVTAQGIGSVGAGPFRSFTRRWTWDTGMGRFLPDHDQFLPSSFRIHLLVDADKAVSENEYNQAFEAYYSVIEDDELQEWADPITEREILGAYAAFRMVHTHLLTADSDSAEAAYTELISDYPPGSIGYDFAQMAEAFWTEYQASSDIISACLSAQAFAISHQETILNALYFGYANPTYTAKEICPAHN